MKIRVFWLNLVDIREECLSELCWEGQRYGTVGENGEFLQAEVATEVEVEGVKVLLRHQIIVEGVKFFACDAVIGLTVNWQPFFCPDASF